MPLTLATHPCAALGKVLIRPSLAFGVTVVDHREVPTVLTAYGPLRIITPTHTVMDRLTAYVHWKDGQSWDQAAMVAERQDIDWSALERWAREEGVDKAHIRRLREAAGQRRT